MVKTIGVISIKGGVGKTTISSSLAVDLVNHYGKKVLLVDANYSAPNLGLHMDILEPVRTVHDSLTGKAKILSAVHTRFGVDVIPGSYICNQRFDAMKLKDRLSQIKDNYDFVIIDSSPSLNSEILSVMSASDNIFMVTTPDYPTLSCTLRALNVAKARGTKVSGIIINKIRDPKYEISLREIEEAVGLPVVAKLPDDKLHTRALFTRIPLPIYSKNSSFSREINNLNAALTNHSEKKSFWKSLLPINMRREEVNRQLLKQSFYSNVFDV